MTRPHYEYAKLAQDAERHGEWRRAEEQYLLAAQQLATSKLAQDTKDRKLYDAAAKRCRRLATIRAEKT